MSDRIVVAERQFDHHAPGYVEDMRSRAEELRQQCPVVHTDAHGGFWVVSRYRDVTGVYHDHRGFSSAYPGITIPPLGSETLPTVTESDEPDHAHYRRALWPFLTPAAVAGYEELIRDNVTRLINEFIETGRADIIEQLAKPVPAVITGRFFGFSAGEGLELLSLFETWNRVSASGDTVKTQAVVGELVEIAEGALDAARREPRDDVNSAIVSYDYKGRTFTKEECVGVLLTAIGGALETTVSAIGFAVYLLGKHPAQRKKLIEHPELAMSAVDEVLRMESPVNASARTVTKPCRIEGSAMQTGDRVLLLVDSANHDPESFEEPEQFRIDRSNNAHLAFGYGIHKCEGQHLARLEIRVVIDELVRRIPEYEVIGSPTAEYSQVYKLTDLHIAFPPGEREPVS